jgi:hypothetical protein
MYLSFHTTEQRDRVYNCILEKANKSCATERSVIEIMHQWVYGKLSNFDYLMALNSAAYRSFSDLSQYPLPFIGRRYPVFPWVLKTYKGTTIDLGNQEVYRDLSKPIGALNPKRLAEVRERFEAMPEEDRFLYGTHYSTPAYVISFLLRKEPLWMIKLQSGNFDNPNRLFHSINKEWCSALENAGNVRELIPQFYMTDSSYLKNVLGLELGVRANKKPVSVRNVLFSPRMCACRSGPKTPTTSLRSSAKPSKAIMSRRTCTSGSTSSSATNKRERTPSPPTTSSTSSATKAASTSKASPTPSNASPWRCRSWSSAKHPGSYL